MRRNFIRFGYRNERCGRRERGIALLLALFALMMLSAIGVALIYMADTDQTINANDRDSLQAYFDARAGLEEARQRLMLGATDQIAGPTALPNSSGANVLYITNPKSGETVNPWATGDFRDTELCHEGFYEANKPARNIPCTYVPAGAVPSTQILAGVAPLHQSMNWKWVRITLKNNISNYPYVVSAGTDGLGAGVSNVQPICWDGSKEVVLDSSHTVCDWDIDSGLKPVYRLTALAVTPAPMRSRRMVQMEVADDPPFVTNAAVDSKDHVTLNGKLNVNGYDYCSCQCTADPKTGVSTCTSASRPGKSCPMDKYGIYSNSTVDDPNKSETIVAPHDPAIGENQPWQYDIEDLIARFKNGAVNVSQAPAYNWSCSGAPLDCGTHSGGSYGIPPAFPPTPADGSAPPASDPNLGPAAPQITYIPGNAHLTGGSVGNGILIVDGDLDINGGLLFYGLILVKGVITFSGGGSNPTNIYGAILAGEQSIDKIDTVLGGSSVVQLNVCALRQSQQPAPPRLLLTNEVSY